MNIPNAKYKYLLTLGRHLLTKGRSNAMLLFHENVSKIPGYEKRLLSLSLRKQSSSRSKRFSNSKIPDQPVTSLAPSELLPEVPEIDIALVQQLERMSLVEFADERGLQELRNAVKSVNKLLLVDTEGIEPLNSVLEDRPLWLRDDLVTEGDCVKDVLSNASKVEEQYFVAPPGNIPLKKKQRENFNTFLEQDQEKES